MKQATVFPISQSPPSIISRHFDLRHEMSTLRRFSSLQKQFLDRARRRITRRTILTSLAIEWRAWTAVPRILRRPFHSHRSPYSL
jgi:hypothetical protein